MFRRAIAAIAVTAALAAPVAARDAVKGDLTLTGAEIRASLGVNPNSGGYLTVVNRGAGADDLIAASCTCAREVQLHLMSMSGSVMSMSRADRLAVPARGRLELRPGGAHLMILGLKKPLRAGETVSMTLTFRRAGKVKATFRVVTQPSAPAAAHQH